MMEKVLELVTDHKKDYTLPTAAPSTTTTQPTTPMTTTEAPTLASIILDMLGMIKSKI